jgi:uncharacterized protein YjbJ (UPF0337 family)
VTGCGRAIRHRRQRPCTLSTTTGAALRASKEGVMDRDEIKGKIDKAKGYAKDKTGELINDPELEAQGEIERGAGAARETFGKAKRKVKEGVEDVAETTDDDR